MRAPPELPACGEVAASPSRGARAGRAGRWSIGVQTSMLLTGCSPATVLNFLAWRHGVEIARSIAYGEGSRRTLDVYRPRAVKGAPVVVFFYGGSWQDGSKQVYQFVASALARSGYVTVAPDYRVYPEVRYPAFLDDGARAVRWTKDNVARFGGDPGKLFIMGHSAGAYNAAMLALDDCWLGKVDLAPDRDIAGLIGISGPYDFLPLRDGNLKIIFGGANDPTTQPINHVTSGAPPALLVTGERDIVVEPSNTARLAARLRAAGNDVTVLQYPWVGHISIIGAFALPLRFLAPVLRDVDGFIAKTEAAPRRTNHAETVP